MESKKQTHRNRVVWWLPRGWGGTGTDESGHGCKLPVLKWMISGDLMYRRVTIVNSIVIHMKVAKNTSLKFHTHTHVHKR